MRSLSCWVVTDGKAGMESQCVGLAAALGLEPVIKRVALRTPWRQLTPFFRLGQRFGFAAHSKPLEPPWPDLLIASGRLSVAASLMVRLRSAKAGRATLTLQLQDPVISPRHFDLVIAPRHDGLEGENVIATIGALHRVTQDVLDAAAALLGPQLGDLPRPYIAALIGGTNNAFQFTPVEMNTIAEKLVAAGRDCGGSVLATPSRRTDPACVEALGNGLRDVPHFLWDGQGDNPYFGILGLADFVVVTCDSVNMVSEALATGKPVFVADLPGGSAKFLRFHRLMREDGLTRSFAGPLQSYAYTPPDDMTMVVRQVRRLLGARGLGRPD